MQFSLHFLLGVAFTDHFDSQIRHQLWNGFGWKSASGQSIPANERDIGNAHLVGEQPQCSIGPGNYAQVVLVCIVADQPAKKRREVRLV